MAMKLRYTIIVLAVVVAMVKGCAPASAQDRPYDHRDGYGEIRDGNQRYDHGDHYDRRDTGMDRRHDDCRFRNHRKGWLIGGGFGAGGGVLVFERPDGTDHEPDAEMGGMGSLRFGYAVSNSVAFTVELHGYGREGNGREWGAGTAVAALTWWPDASGFFLRVGAGGGGARLVEPHAGGIVREMERHGPAGILAAGYEWRVGRKFALSLAVEGAGIALEETEVEDAYDDLKDLAFGFGGVTIQFNWYL
jgi:hypothetical protein